MDTDADDHNSAHVMMGPVIFMVLARIMITVAMNQMVRHNHYGKADHRQHDDGGSDDSTTMMH